MSTQTLPHLVVPPTQVSAQTLFEQTWPAAHTVPQAPQFAGSFLVLVQALPHLVAPPEHTSPQTPLPQT